MRISDSHNDFLTSLRGCNAREKYIQHCKSEGVENLGCAVFTTERTISIDRIICYKNELESLCKKYNINLLLTIEDMGFVKTWEDVERIIKIKPFSVTLTWNYDNQWCGGALGSQGITKVGKQLISELENNGIIIDVAHMNDRSFWDFVRITNKPIFNSHSNVLSQFSHKRNINDRQIQTIKNTGGFLGLTLYQKFISNNIISSKDIALQFDYLCDRFGVDNWGVGSDFHGIEKKFLPNDILDYGGFVNLSICFKNRGYSKDVIKKILSGNFYSLIQKIK